MLAFAGVTVFQYAIEAIYSRFAGCILSTAFLLLFFTPLFFFFVVVVPGLVCHMCACLFDQ